MAASEIVVALDIGTTKVCTLVADIAGEDRVEILGVGLVPSTGMRRGVVADIAATASAIRESVAAAEQMAGVHIATAYVGITGEHIASLNRRGKVQVPAEIGEEHLQQARQAARNLDLEPGREILHHIPRQYIVDGIDRVRHPVGMSATELEVESHIVTAASSFVENVAKCVQRAGLQIEEIVVEPLATGLAVLTDAERQLGVALADIGGGTTDVALFADGAISHTTVLPIGGNLVTSDLTLCFRLAPEDAESVKLAHGAARPVDVDRNEYVEVHMIGDTEPREIPRPLLPQVIGPRMTELFEMLKQHLVKAAEEGVIVNSCVLSGGGSQLLGAVELAESVLELPVRIGKPREVIDPRGLVDSPVFATAVGMLHYAAQRSAGRPRSREPESLQSSAWGMLTRLFRRFAKGKKERPPRRGRS